GGPRAAELLAAPPQSVAAGPRSSAPRATGPPGAELRAEPPAGPPRAEPPAEPPRAEPPAEPPRAEPPRAGLPAEPLRAEPPGEPPRADARLDQVTGILDLSGERWYLRTAGYRLSPGDVSVPRSLILRFGLRRGDHIEGAARMGSEGRSQGA